MPKHRGPSSSPLASMRSRAWLAVFGVVLLASVLTFASGILGGGAGSGGAASAALPTGDAARHRPSLDPADLGDRRAGVSRSDRRTAVDPVKKSALDQHSGGQVTHAEDLTDRDPRAVARALLGRYGFGPGQFPCLDALYVSESGWDVHADNPTSSAYGIPQALPGSKMASAGPDWANNPATQIRWGLGYIRASYGTPCAAWSFKQSHHWY